MGTIHHIHERRARPRWNATPIEEKLPKEDSPWVIVACVIGSILLNGGCVFLLMTGGTP